MDHTTSINSRTRITKVLSQPIMDDRNRGSVLFRSQFNSIKLPVVKRIKGFVVHDLNLYFKDLINADAIPDSQMHYASSQDNGMSASHESSSQLDRSHSQADEILQDESVVSAKHSAVETEQTCHDILRESSCISDHKSRLKDDESSSELDRSQVDENVEGESAVCSENLEVESEEIRCNTARQSSVVSDHASCQEHSTDLKKAVNNDHDTADESEPMFESNDETEQSDSKEPNAISPSPESIVSRTKFSVPITTVANIINSRSISQSKREESDVGSSTSGQPLKYKHPNKYCESQANVALANGYKDASQAPESLIIKISKVATKKQNKTRNMFESPARKVRRIKYYTDEEVEGDESENSDNDDKQCKHKIINNVRNKSNEKFDNDSSDKNVSEIQIIHLRDNMVLKDKEFVKSSDDDSMRDVTMSSSTEEILNADVLEIIDGDKLCDPARAADGGMVVKIAKKVEPESLPYSLDFDTSEDESGEMECETESENTEQRLKVGQCDIDKQSQEKQQRKEQVDQPREKGSDNTKILSKTDNSLKARGMDNAACSTIGLDKCKQNEDRCKTAVGDSSRTAVDKSSVAVDECKAAEDRSKAIIDEYKATIDKCKKAVDKGKAAVNKEKSATDKYKAAEDSSGADKNKAVKESSKPTVDKNKAAEDCSMAAVDKDAAAVDKNKAAVDKEKAAVDKDTAAADKEKTAVEKNKAAADKDMAVVDKPKATAAEGMVSVEKSKSGADRLQAAGNINNEVRNNSETVHVQESKVVQVKEHSQSVKDKQGKAVLNVERTARESSKLDAKSEVSRINQVRECVNIGDKNKKIDATSDKPSHSGNNDDNCCGIEGWITTRAGLRTITRKVQIGRQDNESTAEKDGGVTGAAKKSTNSIEADEGGNGNDLSTKCSRLHNKYKFTRRVTQIDEEVEGSSDQESCELVFNDEGVASDDRQQDCRADTGVYTVIDSDVDGVKYMGGVNEGASTSRTGDNIGRKSAASASAAGNTCRTGTESDSERVIVAVISGSSSTDFVSPQPLNTGGQSMFFTARDQASKSGGVSPEEDLDVGWKGSKTQGATTRKGTQKKRKPWTEEEELIVYKGVQTYGVGQWTKFQHKLPFRSNIDIKDKWRVIQKQGREKYLSDLLKKQQ